jgi:hypothetical protein
MATKKFNANQYSAKWLRKQGYECESTEQTVRIPDNEAPRDATGRPSKWKMFKRDLFNFCDLIAIKYGETGTTYIQTTTAKNVNARLEKIAGIAVVRPIIKAGNHVHVHGWKELGGKGKPRSWHLTITEVTFDEDGLMQTKLLDAETIADPGTTERQSEMEFALEF